MRMSRVLPVVLVLAVAVWWWWQQQHPAALEVSVNECEMGGILTGHNNHSGLDNYLWESISVDGLFNLD